jgi:hypothetical protein
MPCKGLTKKNKQCKISTKHYTGYCKRHIDQYNEEEDEKEDDEKEYKNTAKRLLEKIKKEKLMIDKENKVIEKKNKVIEKKSKELIADVEINKKNWNKLYSNMVKNLAKNQSELFKLIEQKRSIMINMRSILNIKQNTEFLITKTPEKYSTLIDMILIYTDYLEDSKTESKEINMKIEKLEKININIKKFNTYYITKKTYIPKIDSYRTKTTDHYQCTICLEEGIDGLVLDCGHKFDLKCISEWFSTNLNCPTCRTELV